MMKLIRPGTDALQLNPLLALASCGGDNFRIVIAVLEACECCAQVERWRHDLTATHVHPCSPSVMLRCDGPTAQAKKNAKMPFSVVLSEPSYFKVQVHILSEWNFTIIMNFFVKDDWPNRTFEKLFQRKATFFQPFRVYDCGIVEIRGMPQMLVGVNISKSGFDNPIERLLHCYPPRMSSPPDR